MSENPLVTVVIPTWNRRPLVEAAVKSVVAQTYPHWELIVVDDGSTDGTVEHLEALGESRLRVLAKPHSGQLGHLRNCGAAAGSGELIAFLDSDDVWLPKKLEIQVRALQGSAAGWCYGAYEMMNTSGETIPMTVGRFQPLSGRVIRETLTYDMDAAPTTLVVRRALFDAIGRFSEDPRLVAREDQELNLRLALHADAIAVPELIARLREHPQRTGHSVVDPYERSARVYEVFLEGHPPADLAALARRYWARELVNAGRQRLAAGEFARAARLFGITLTRGARLRHWGGALVYGFRDWIRRGKRARPSDRARAR